MLVKQTLVSSYADVLKCPMRKNKRCSNSRVFKRPRPAKALSRETPHPSRLFPAVTSQWSSVDLRSHRYGTHKNSQSQ